MLCRLLVGTAVFAFCCGPVRAVAASGGNEAAPLLTGEPAEVEVLENYECDTFQPGVKLFMDRVLVLKQSPDSLKGQSFVRGSIEMLNFRCTKSGVITLLSPDPASPKATSQAGILEAKGFVRAGVPAFQLFGKEEFNRVLIYQKQVEQGQEYRLGKWSVLVGSRVVTRWYPSQPKSWAENDGELLYNGIVLPAVWPPRTGNSSSLEPMDVPYLTNLPSLIPIDIGRQLFVDDFLIEKSDLTRTFYQAKKYVGNPVLTPADTDGMGAGKQCRLQTGGAFYDPAERVFKIFYDAGWEGGLALATSTNLLNWNRPDWGLAGGNLLLGPGFKDDNGAGREKTVWLDLNAAKSDERLKLMSTRVSSSDGKLAVRQTLQTSADGRVWSPVTACAKAEDYSSFFYNPFRKVWVYSLKGTSNRTPRGRCRYYFENRDFLTGANWTDKVYWTDADRLDEPDPAIGDAAQLYCHNAVAYESLMLGMFQIHLGPNNKICAKGKHPKLTELKLGFSRDGFHWQRPDRRAFIGATRREGDWDRAYLHNTAGVCLVMDDKLWFPYAGFSGIAPDGTHGSHLGASIGFATLRRDGFASMDAGKNQGTLTTRLITFKGKYLFVNLNAPQGELRVEVLDDYGNVIAPFSAAKCVPLNGDKTKQRVTWQDAETLAAVSGQPVRLRFLLMNGSLFSFWITPDKNGASHGYVAAGGPDFYGVMDNGIQPAQVAR